MADASIKKSLIETPLGLMLAVADEMALLSLEFTDTPPSSPGLCPPLSSIAEELALYFAGRLREFKTPFAMNGTPFQKQVWAELGQIPYGNTISYSMQAERIGRPSAMRAVALANAANRFAILIPCHRVIRANGELSGYGGGVFRKKWLLDHEKQHHFPACGLEWEIQR